MKASRSHGALTLPALATLLVAVLAATGVAKRPTKRQSYQTHNLTPDGFWHNRYHALLSMALYGDYNNLCPNQTFTEATLKQNFPNSTRPPWTVVSTFGPTPSGASGVTLIVPEMNKALIVFRGDYELEQTLPLDVVYWNETGLPAKCTGCTVNKFAAQGYFEAKNETNDWADIKGQYEGEGLVFSIAGHGLGGMHSQIAAIDLYQENIDYYNHAYGAPRTFNSLGATWYADRFNGEAGERGVANNDQYTEFIPEGENYTHAGTPFYYWGYNSTSEAMLWTICWLEDNPDYSACMPRDQNSGFTPEQDHYFYFTPVTQCGGLENAHENATFIDPFLASVNGSNGGFTTSAGFYTSTSSSSATSSAPTSTAPPPAGTTAADNSGGSSGASTLTVSSTAVFGAVILLAFF